MHLAPLFEPSLGRLGAVILCCVIVCSHEAESSPVLPKHCQAFCRGSPTKQRSRGRWRSGLETLTSFTLINRLSFRMQPKSKCVVVGEAGRVGMCGGVSDPSGIAREFPCPLATGSCQRRGGRDGGRKPLEKHSAQCRSSSCHPHPRFGKSCVQGDGSSLVAFVSLIANSKALLFSGGEGRCSCLHFSSPVTFTWLASVSAAEL